MGRRDSEEKFFADTTREECCKEGSAESLEKCSLPLKHCSSSSGRGEKQEQSPELKSEARRRYRTMSLIFQFAKSLLSEKIRSRFKTHSGLESLQRSVDPSFLPAEYGGTTSVADCIASWKVELEEGRAELLQLDQLKVDSSAPVGEQLALVRKKSRHDSGSGSEVLSMMGNMRKHEAEP